MNLSDDIIDVRKVIERVEELESERDDCTLTQEDGSEEPDPIGWADQNPDEAAELRTLESLLDDLKGYGGDEQWRGDWYPLTLIRRSYFVDYARELAEDTDAVDANATWPHNCIDWDYAARELEADYSSVDIDGTEYLYR